MKKLLAICLSMVMVMCVSITAFAAPDGFVNSPSGNNSPEVEEFEPQDEECTAKLVVTPFSDKDSLSPTLKALFDKAYESIVNATDLTTLNAELAKLVEQMNIEAQNLAVSDLFDLHVTDCDFHEGHFTFRIVLKSDTLENFVGLLHMTKDGTWELVPDAKVTNDGTCLEFSVESFSPFAVVVNNTEETGTSSSSTDPGTGEGIMIYVYIAIAAICTTALVIIFVVLARKKRKEDQ